MKHGHYFITISFIIIIHLNKLKCNEKSKFRIIEYYEEPSLPLDTLCTTQENNIKCITLCTHTSIDRIHLIAAQSLYWQGPMSISIIIQNKAEDWDKLNDFVKDHFNGESSSTLANFASIHVVVTNELIDKKTYPINMLRNIAMKNAHSDWVFNVDIDFIPNLSSHSKALEHKKYIIDSYFKSSKKAAFVVPAFETDKPRLLKMNTMPYAQFKENLQTILPKDKSSLRDMYKKHELAGFHEKSFPKGHGQTNLPKWFEDGGSYEIKYGDKYEPFLIFNRLTTPVYDEDFEGRYYNKVSHVWELHENKFKFFVLKDLFIIHLNHQRFSDADTRENNLKKFHEKKKQTGTTVQQKTVEMNDAIDNVLSHPDFKIKDGKLIGWSCIFGECSFQKCSMNDEQLCLFISSDYQDMIKINGFPHQNLIALAQKVDIISYQKVNYKSIRELLELRVNIELLENIDLETPLEVWIEIQFHNNGKESKSVYPLEIEKCENIAKRKSILSFKPFKIYDDDILSMSIGIMYNIENKLQKEIAIKSAEVKFIQGNEKFLPLDLNDLYRIEKNIFAVHDVSNKSITLVCHSYIEDFPEIKESLIEWGKQGLISLSLYAVSPSTTLKVLKDESHWMKDHYIHIITPHYKNLEYPDHILINTGMEAAKTEWILLTDLNIKITKSLKIQELLKDINIMHDGSNKNLFILPVYDKVRSVYQEEDENSFINTKEKSFERVESPDLYPLPFPMIFRRDQFPNEKFLKSSKRFTSLAQLWIMRELSKTSKEPILLNDHFLFRRNNAYTSFESQYDHQKMFNYVQYLSSFSE